MSIIKHILFFILLINLTNANAQNNFLAVFEKAKENWETKNYNTAIDNCTKAIELSEFNSNNNFRKKIIEIERSNSKEQVSRKLYTDVAKCYALRGRCRYEIKDFENAGKDFWNVTMINPKFVEGYYWKGKSYYELGIMILAEHAFNEALNLDSTDAEIYFLRGKTKYESKKYKNAILDYTKALEIHCCPAEAYYERGRAKNKSGDVEGAIEDFNKAISGNPDYAWAYQERGLAKAQSGDIKAAMSDYNISLRIQPNARTYRCRGQIKYMMEDYYGAIKDCDESILLDEYFPVAFSIRGLSKIKIGQKDFGCLDLSKAGELGFSPAYDMIKELCNK